jgi:predicted hotdog family 3-hydroxylacyl-ACP dehydratase
MMTMSHFPVCDPADLLSHRDSMLLISRILRVDARSSEVEIEIDQYSSFFIAEKGVPGWVGIEYISQAAAVIAGYQGRNRNSSIPQGYLLGTRHYVCSVPFFAAGSCLHVSCIEEAFHDNGLGVYHGVIVAGEKLAECRLNIFRNAIE